MYSIVNNKYHYISCILLVISTNTYLTMHGATNVKFIEKNVSKLTFLTCPFWILSGNWPSCLILLTGFPHILRYLQG